MERHRISFSPRTREALHFSKVFFTHSQQRWALSTPKMLLQQNQNKAVVLHRRTQYHVSCIYLLKSISSFQHYIVSCFFRGFMWGPVDIIQRCLESNPIRFQVCSCSMKMSVDRKRPITNYKITFFCHKIKYIYSEKGGRSFQNI